MSKPLRVSPDPDSGTWILHPSSQIRAADYVAVLTVELHDDGLDAHTDVELWWPPTGTDQDLLAFRQTLTDDWRGWRKNRQYLWTATPGDRQSVERRRSSQLWRAATAALLIRASGTSRSKAWIPPGHTCNSALPPACQIRPA